MREKVPYHKFVVQGQRPHIAKAYGNAAHVYLPKKMVGKIVSITPIDQIEIKKRVTKNGNGGHICLPKTWLGKRVHIEEVGCL